MRQREENRIEALEEAQRHPVPQKEWHAQQRGVVRGMGGMVGEGPLLCHVSRCNVVHVRCSSPAARALRGEVSRCRVVQTRDPPCRASVAVCRSRGRSRVRSAANAMRWWVWRRGVEHTPVPSAFMFFVPPCPLGGDVLVVRRVGGEKAQSRRARDQPVSGSGSAGGTRDSTPASGVQRGRQRVGRRWSHVPVTVRVQVPSETRGQRVQHGGAWRSAIQRGRCHIQARWNISHVHAGRRCPH